MTTPPIFTQGQTILFQGDSITDGNRVRSADPNHILGHGYQFEIAALYGSAYPGLNLKFMNRGVSGDTLDLLSARWQQDTLDLKPDVLSVLIGINDIWNAHRSGVSFDADKAFTTYDRLLASATQARPSLKLVLCEPFVLEVGDIKKDPAGWHADIDKMKLIVERLGSKYHAAIVDFQAVFNRASADAPLEYWIWDGVHPTYAGHGLMADAWIAAYNDTFRSPLVDPARNSAIAPQVNFERDSYDWLHRHADVLDAQAKTDPDVVMIGDSITHFWGGEPKSAQANAPEEWNKTFVGLKVLNLGFGWDRTQNVLWRLQHGELKGTPRTIVLNIGTNNLVGDQTARENSPEETAEGIKAVVAALRERCPNAKIVVMGVFPRGFEKDNPLDLRIRQLNSILATAFTSDSKVEFLDIGARLRSTNGAVIPDMFSDGTHPTAKGYAIWGAALRDGGYLR